MGASGDAQWASDLVDLGYGDPLPAPAPAVQATLASMKSPAIHAYVNEQDRAALLDCDDDGEHAPLLLTTLDLSQWTLILNLVIRDSEDKALGQLRIAQSKLAEMLDVEAEELAQAEKDAVLVDKVIKAANPHEGAQKSTSASDPANASNHPFLSGLNIAPAQVAALEDLVDSIQSSQAEKDLALLMASGKGPVVPFTPSRTIEAQVAEKSHRCWGLPNINLLAPISIPMWKTWTNMQPAEVAALKANAIYATGILREGVPIPGAFPLSLFDNKKCGSPDVSILTKQSLHTNYGRISKYSSAVWNCQRPYLRCACRSDSSKGCKGDVMWFDHAIWYMVNNLHVFFESDEYPTLVTKFGAFIVWLSNAARVAVRHQITFHHIRDLMVEASLEYAADSTAKLLANYPQGAGILQIEKWIKPPSFSAANPGTPGSSSSHKRQRTSININAPARREDDSSTPPLPRSGQRHTTRGGRGGYNRRYRQPHQGGQQARQQPRAGVASNPPNPNEAFVMTGPAYRNSPRESGTLSLHTRANAPNQSRSQFISSTPSQDEAATTSSSKVERPSMKGRFLDWDSMDH